MNFSHSETESPHRSLKSPLEKDAAGDDLSAGKGRQWAPRLLARAGPSGDKGAGPAPARSHPPRLPPRAALRGARAHSDSWRCWAASGSRRAPPARLSGAAAARGSGLGARRRRGRGAAQARMALVRRRPSAVSWRSGQAPPSGADRALRSEICVTHQLTVT